MSQENVEMLRHAYEAAVRRDWKALRALGDEYLAPDFEFESIVTGQVYKGAQRFGDMVTDIWETLDYMPATEEIIDLGEEVLVVLRVSGHGARSGAPVSQQIAIVYTFEGERIVRGKSFTSRAEALEAAGLSE
jgi:ketosteroid isomerase-like protein